MSLDVSVLVSAAGLRVAISVDEAKATDLIATTKRLDEATTLCHAHLLGYLATVRHHRGELEFLAVI